MSGSPHKKADMESCLPNCPPILNIPTVLSELLRMRFFSLPSYQFIKKITVFKLKAEGIITQSLS